MDELAQKLLNPYIAGYILFVILVQLGVGGFRQWRQSRIARRRRGQGLSEQILMDHSEQLSGRRFEAILESVILILAIFLPIILINLPIKFPAGTLNGLGLAMWTLIVWILFSGTEVAKSFLGGLMYKTVVAFNKPFQVGDRVTLKGISGKVKELDIFFVKLQTLNNELISFPTYTLWNEVLTSANAGDRSSLCVMDFYLAAFVSSEQRQQAEDAIWDAIQSSVYYEPAKPMQIYLSQTQDAIRLTAKAYVASTYNESLFKSDVTRAFLDFASDQKIALAPGS